MKKLIVLFLCVVLVLSASLPAYAANARMSHGIYCDYDFYIGSSGSAEVSVYYEGNATTFTDITVETYIQKRTLGFIWTKVDNGEPNKTWVDTSTSRTGTFIHDLQLDSTGTYRAVFTVTFSGIGASSDVIENEIEDVYS
ncbi:MAG: hypothetical protein IJW99_03765 [Clostridia bacterium]|nr:hypothetical protein [Clostridia bacterium]